jgi:hypothetical protein
MKILRLSTMIAASVLLFFTPLLFSPTATAFSPKSSDMALFGVTIPAGVNGCTGGMPEMKGSVMSMDICVMGYVQGPAFPTGTQYIGNEKLSMVLVPTSTPGVFRVLGHDQGQIIISNQYGSMLSKIGGTFKGTITFDASGNIASYGFALKGVVHIEGGTGAYANATGNGQYSGTSDLMSTSPFVEQDAMQVFLRN